MLSEEEMRKLYADRAAANLMNGGRPSQDSARRLVVSILTARRNRSPLATQHYGFERLPVLDTLGNMCAQVVDELVALRLVAELLFGQSAPHLQLQV